MEKANGSQRITRVFSLVYFGTVKCVLSCLKLLLALIAYILQSAVNCVVTLATGNRYSVPFRPTFRKWPPAYYRTEEWKRKRAQAFEQHGRHCKICNGTKRLQVHHVRYTTRGKEHPRFDLVPLCQKHHPKGRYTWNQICRDEANYRWYKWWLR